MGKSMSQRCNSKNEALHEGCQVPSEDKMTEEGEEDVPLPDSYVGHCSLPILEVHGFCSEKWLTALTSLEL